MAHSTWSAAEKKIARRVFEAAVDRELQALLAEFKAKATSIQDPTSIWPIRDWLDRRQREIDSEFDFRYSVLVSVFGRLVRDGRVSIDDLEGLDEDKLAQIRLIGSY